MFLLYSASKIRFYPRLTCSTLLYIDLLPHPYIVLTTLYHQPGGPLEGQGGYQARPKIHVIRVVFQDQAL